MIKLSFLGGLDAPTAAMGPVPGWEMAGSAQSCSLAGPGFWAGTPAGPSFWDGYV